MDISFLKKLLNRQIVCLVLAIAPIGTVSFATGLFSWIWILFILSIGLLLLEKLLLSHWSAQGIGYSCANKISSLKKRNWAKFFWFVNFLFLFGGWEMWKVEKWILLFYWIAYIFFQYWGFKLVFRGK